MGHRIVFFGTPQFSATVLEFLIKKKINIVAVVTRPDRSQGRSSKLIATPVKKLARFLIPSVPIFQPEKASDPEFAENVLHPLDADLFVVVAYAEIFKENLLAMPKVACVNVHASLLPKYRGAAPIQRCIMAGDTESGVTIMMMKKELDAGNMLSMEKTPVHPDMTSGELFEELSHSGAKALWKVLCDFETGTISPIEQDDSLVTKAPKLKHHDGKIQWDRPAQEVYNHIRGVTPKPGAWTTLEIQNNQKKLLIKKSRLDQSVSAQPGEFVSTEDGLAIACQSGGVRLIEVQLEGKKAMQAADFWRGISNRNPHVID